MNAQNDPNNQNRNEAPDWRTARQMRRDERRAMRGSRPAGWVGGAVLILLGIVFLLQNLGGLNLQNWWALFILIPAVGAFGNAWNAFQKAGGHLDAAARGSLIAGILFSMLTAIFLFNLNMTILGPVLVILLGLGVLLNTLLP